MPKPDPVFSVDFRGTMHLVRMTVKEAQALPDILGLLGWHNVKVHANLKPIISMGDLLDSLNEE